ncbi:hypothetical protein ACIBCD_07695 [Nocardia brasiliensis]|uniref:hypothetical protein n=1 Tax=Nocardia brasiliensis TaxID=37326 RepID=UPI0037BCAFBE
MDALHPRLLVGRFAECFDFYSAVLPELLGAELMKGTAAGPYANWDVDGQGVLVLFDRAAMAEVVGTAARPVQPAQDTVMFVCRVPEVAAAPTCASGTGRRSSPGSPSGRTGGRTCAPRTCVIRRAP